MKIADLTIQNITQGHGGPKSEAIPPVIFVILLRAGVAVEVMCKESA